MVEQFTEEFILPRLMKHTEEKDGHKLWTGYKVNGYGVINLYKKTYLVHRLSAFLYLDLDITNKKEQALHKHKICDFRNCWNQEHLYVGTADDNARDNRGSIKNWSRNVGKTYCDHGHEFTLENTYINPTSGNRTCRVCKSKYEREYHGRL